MRELHENFELEEDIKVDELIWFVLLAKGITLG